MKKNSIVKQSPKRAGARARGRITIGVDLGDKSSRFCVLNADGEVETEGAVPTTSKGLAAKFAGLKGCRMVIEVGTHSPWVSRLLEGMGHEVIVANARQVRLISDSSRKDDRMDAETLARLGRVDPQLLRPIRHRSERAQQHLLLIRVRATLVESRTKMVNAARGLIKALGERLPSCAADTLKAEHLAALPEPLRDPLKPLLEQIESLTREIHELDKQVEQIARTEYPETQLLRQIHGVGALIALTFVLTLDDETRFSRSRDVGCYLGLRPRRSQSGASQPQLHVTKEGDRYLRTLLVQGAHQILKSRAPDTDLKRWGTKLCQHGGKIGKKRAVTAVARKLAVLLHRLWVSGEVYEPLRNHPVKSQAA